MVMFRCFVLFTENDIVTLAPVITSEKREKTNAVLSSKELIALMEHSWTTNYDCDLWNMWYNTSYLSLLTA